MLQTVLSATMWLLALGLATDATLLCALESSQNRYGARIWLLPLFTAIAQATMPLIGAAAGGQVVGVADWLHYGVAAVFLVLAYRLAFGDDELRSGGHVWWRYVVMAAATSIDALVAGTSLPFLEVQIWYACGLIGGVTWVACTGGVLLGARLSERFARPTRIVGSVLLLAAAVDQVL